MKQDYLKKLPEEIEVELFITISIEGWNAGKINVHDFNGAKYNDDQVLLGTQTVKFKIPQNIDVKGEAVKNLEENKKKLQAKHHMELKEIQDKIDQLKAIEYKPELRND